MRYQITQLIPARYHQALLSACCIGFWCILVYILWSFLFLSLSIPVSAVTPLVCILFKSSISLDAGLSPHISNFQCKFNFQVSKSCDFKRKECAQHFDVVIGLESKVLVFLIEAWPKTAIKPGSFQTLSKSWGFSCWGHLGTSPWFCLTWSAFPGLVDMDRYQKYFAPWLKGGWLCDKMDLQC